jgi:hypothetical protein
MAGFTEFTKPQKFSARDTALLLVDNTKYLDRVNETDLKAKLKRPTKTVVIAQDPDPSDQVPRGTQVTLTLTSKNQLPLDGLGAIDAVTKKWVTAGVLEDAVDKAEAVKTIIAKDVEYAQLSQGDKGVVDEFLIQNLGEMSEADRGKAFGDVGFVYRL